MGNLLNMSGGCLLRKSLPYDYEVEYLESSGTQYIDTLYVANSNTEFRMKYRGFKDKIIFTGGRINYGYPSVVFNTGGTMGSDYNLYFIQYVNNGGYQCPKCPNDENVHIVEMTRQVFVDGVLIAEFPQVVFNTYVNFYLFAMNSNTIHIGYIRIYESKLIDNGITVRDFIPVVKDNVGYMYDKVSGQLFGNQGTGSFIVGPRV